MSAAAISGARVGDGLWWPASHTGAKAPLLLEVGMHVNAGDTAWMLTSTALVFFMMPGLALFYGGLVGAKNVIATMVQSFVAIGVISFLWGIFGYSLAFRADPLGVVGRLPNLMLRRG